MTEPQEAKSRRRRWRRRALFAIVILALCFPFCTVRTSRGDRCPICGEGRGETYWQIYVVRIPTENHPAPDCIDGEHHWFRNWHTTKMLISSGSGLHGDFFLRWTSMSRLQLRPWLMGNLPARDRQRVLQALRVATRAEVDEILSSDLATELGAALLEGPDSEWASGLAPWAERVLRRAGE